MSLHQVCVTSIILNCQVVASSHNDCQFLVCAALVRLFEREFDSNKALAKAVAVLQKAKASNARLALVGDTGKLCMSNPQFFAIPQCILSEANAGSMLDIPDDAVPVEPPTTNPKHFLGPSEQIAKIMRHRLDFITEDELKTVQSQQRVSSTPRKIVCRDQVSKHVVHTICLLWAWITKVLPRSDLQCLDS